MHVLVCIPSHSHVYAGQQCFLSTIIKQKNNAMIDSPVFTAAPVYRIPASWVEKRANPIAKGALGELLFFSTRVMITVMHRAKVRNISVLANFDSECRENRASLERWPLMIQANEHKVYSRTYRWNMLVLLQCLLLWYWLAAVQVEYQVIPPKQQ